MVEQLKYCPTLCSFTTLFTKQVFIHVQGHAHQNIDSMKTGVYTQSETWLPIINALQETCSIARTNGHAPVNTQRVIADYAPQKIIIFLDL